jgi:hypothetical protein
MTRDEAKEFITQSVKSDVDMALVADAIKTLEQEPCEDTVSRKAVFETIDDCNSDGLKGIFCSYDDGERFKEYIKNLPSVTPQEPFKPMVEIDLYSVIKQKYIEREVLDKIRAEIEKETDRDDHADEYCDGYYDGMRKALAIIDKHKAESEKKE